MNNEVMPRWMADEAARLDLEKARADAEAQRQLAAQLAIQSGGSKFFADLGKELDRAARNLDGAFGLCGQFSDLPTQAPERESAYRLDVRSQTAFPKMAYTNLFFARGERLVRCTTEERKAFYLTLCARENAEIRAFAENGFTPLDAEQAAEWIVRRMVNAVR